MPNSQDLPKVIAPAYRETKSGKTWTETLRGDLKQVAQQAPLWVRAKTIEGIRGQHAAGNSKQFTAIVDGSKTKPIQQAMWKVHVYFVSAVLTRTLGRAKDVLRKAIERGTKRHTGVLSDRWSWYLQQGGKKGTLTYLGESLPGDLSIRATDRLILAPRAEYAWFANYYALHSRAIVKKYRKPRKDKSGQKFADGRDAGMAKSMGFMQLAARQLRPELKRINFTVFCSWTKESPPAPNKFHSEKGIPILVFRALPQTAAGV
jgi:hypothetical protein